MAKRDFGIVGQTLVPMVLGTLAVAGSGAWLAYTYAADRERDLVLTRIESRISRQAETEATLFRTVAADLGHSRRLLRLRHDPERTRPALSRDLDGVYRDTNGPMSMFIGPDIDDPVAAVARDLLAELGPDWCASGRSMAIASPGQWLVGYGPHYAALVGDLLPADPILLPSEQGLLARPGTEVRWSSAYLEPATDEWRVAALIPIDLDGRRYAAIQELPVVDLLKSLSEASPGVTAAVWGPGGQLLADSRSGIGGTADAVTRELKAAIPASGPEVELLEMAGGDWLGVVRLALPGWIVASRHDREAVLGPARRAAQVVLVVGLVAVLAQIVILTLVLRRRVREPLRRLGADVERLAAGEQVLATDLSRRDEVGKLVRSFRDMSEAVSASERGLKGALEQLQRSEALYRALFDSAADAVLVLRGGEIVQANTSAATLFGRSRDELVGARAEALAPELQADERPSELVWAELIASHDGRVRPWRAAGSGGLRETEVAIGRADQSDGELLVAVVRDVTDRNQLEDQLQQGQKMESLGQLAGGIAHDFNNMLGAMVGTAELLAAKLDDQADRDLAERILRTGERAAALTNRLLAFARRGRSLSTPVDLHRMVTDAVALLEASIDRRVKLEVELGCERVAAVGDGAALQNALLNLGLNARDAMLDGGRLRIVTGLFDGPKPGEAWSRSPPDGAAIEIAVADTGTGMSPEVLERIFEPFYTTKPVGKGTGLGLAAVYRTVHDHGGALRVESEPGVGTTFHLVIPLAEEAGERDPTKQVQTLAGKGTVLLIDDEELVRSTSRQMLQALGYHVIQAADGAAGLEAHAAAADRIDLVMVDMEMPEMRGSEVLVEIHRRDPELPVVLCSGFSRDASSEDLKELGAAAFLNKPFRLAELSRVVAQSLAAPR